MGRVIPIGQGRTRRKRVGESGNNSRSRDRQETVERPCRMCWGTGLLSGRRCRNCHGRGRKAPVRWAWLKWNARVLSRPPTLDEGVRRGKD
jgi:hypothetical protein